MTEKDKTLANMKRILKELGFSGYESEVLAYLSLTRSSLKAREISSATGVPRTKVYSALYSLAEDNLVSIDPRRPMIFSAPPPEILSSLLFSKVIEEATRKISIIKKFFYLEVTEGLWILGEVILPINKLLIEKISPILINDAREFLILIISSKNKRILPKELPNVKISLLVDSHEAYKGIKMLGPRDIRIGNHGLFAIISERAALISDDELEKGLYVSEKRMLKVIMEMAKSLYISGLPEG